MLQSCLNKQTDCYVVTHRTLLRCGESIIIILRAWNKILPQKGGIDGIENLTDRISIELGRGNILNYKTIHELT